MKRFSLILAMLFIPHVIFPQPDLKFVHYTTEQGLVNNDVLSINQDTLGFIWFGTKEGVSRFDGIEFKNYQSNKLVPGSIADGWVNKIICDKQNRLWFAIAGAGSTFMSFDYNTEKFTDFTSLLKEKLNIKVETFNFWNINIDSNGRIWPKTRNCPLIYFDPKINEITVFDSKSEATTCFEDNENNLWFRTSQGLMIYNETNKKYTKLKHEPSNPSSISSNSVQCIFQDSGGQMWFGTVNGLNRLISPLSDSAKFERFMHDPHNPTSISNNFINEIQEYSNKYILVATNNGLCLFDKQNKSFHRYFNDNLDNESIISNLIQVIFTDKDDNIWIGTNSGVAKIQDKYFKSFSQSFYKNSISHNQVHSICLGPDSNIWIATPKGIDIYNPVTNHFSFLKGVTRNTKGLYGSPIFLNPGKNKGMWIGTWKGGLSYYDYTRDHMNNYIEKIATKSLQNIFAVLHDSKNNIWVNNYSIGLYMFNLITGESKMYYYDPDIPNSLSNGQAHVIIEDSDSNIWIGTEKGLNVLIDAEKGSFKHFLDVEQINHISDDNEKNIWIGSESGLSIIHKKTWKVKKFGVQSGLPAKSIYSILLDADNNLWASTNKGLLKICMSSNNDSIIQIKTYRKEDGLSIGSYRPHSCAKMEDGRLLFGGTKGFCVFEPSKVLDDSIAPAVHFTKLKIRNKTISVGQKINDQIILQKSISFTNQLSLNYKNNAFSIEFAALHYSKPKYNQYTYRLEGFDKPGEWIHTDGLHREVGYVNLPNGSYTLYVKAANSSGIWNDQPAVLNITILPPWWRTFWFRVMVTVMLIFLIIIIIRIRTYSLQRQKQSLLKLVEKRTEELRSTNIILSDRTEELERQMEEMAIINNKLEAKTIQVEDMANQLHDADQSKLQFFANISHEFRTPLTLIIGPLEEVLFVTHPLNPKHLKKHLQLMHKNAKRLLRLVNQIIDIRKLDSGQKKVTLTNNNLQEFVAEVVNAFQSIAEAKRIHLKVETHGRASQLLNDFWFDPDIFEKILYNILSNAIKYTPEGGEIFISFGIPAETNGHASLHNKLEIKISDTGMGIPPEDINKIFDRFYRGQNEGIIAGEGTGIGLAYTKELVELHKGSITVESEPGKGATFILHFQIGKDHFDKETKKDNAAPMKLSYIHSMIEKSEILDFVRGDKTESENEHEDQNIEKEQLLIVEDSEDLRNFMKDELKSQYNVLTAENGEIGWKTALNSDPKLIISDIMMPVMDGIELCNQVKSNEHTSHIPIILLTAKTGEENILKGLETGADDYISKPFNMKILKAKINNQFQLQKRIWENFNRSINIEPSEITHSIIDKQFLQKAIQIVNENLQNPEFDNKLFICLMNCSRSVAYRKLKALTNMSVSEFIRSIRLKTAAKLFLQGNDNVTDVCYLVGFKQPSLLTRNFSKMFGMTPSEFIHKNIGKV